MTTWKKSAYRIGLIHRDLMHGCPLTASSMIFWKKMNIFAQTVSAARKERLPLNFCNSWIRLRVDSTRFWVRSFSQQNVFIVQQHSRTKQPRKQCNATFSRDKLFSSVFWLHSITITKKNMIERRWVVWNAVALFVLHFLLIFLIVTGLDLSFVLTK